MLLEREAEKLFYSNLFLSCDSVTLANAPLYYHTDSVFLLDLSTSLFFYYKYSYENLSFGFQYLGISTTPDDEATPLFLRKILVRRLFKYLYSMNNLAPFQKLACHVTKLLPTIAKLYLNTRQVIYHSVIHKICSVYLMENILHINNIN